MATKDGERFLGPQVQSFFHQSHKDWVLRSSDDGSTDGTPQKLGSHQQMHPSLIEPMQLGPKEGFASNFLSLLQHCDPTIQYAAFADQDDVWLPHKLEYAVKILRHERGPAIYCGRTIIVDKELRIQGLSPVFSKPPSFSNALVQSIAGGNTMVLNFSAKDLLAEAATFLGSVVSHDWWAYQLITGAGGNVIYDKVPAVLYRQHDGNAVGCNKGPKARIDRLAKMLKGEFQTWTDANLNSLTRARQYLTKVNQSKLDEFLEIRSASTVKRGLWFARSNVYRQTRLGTASMVACGALGLI